MTDYMQLLWPLLAGLGIGAFYFGGLWLTVRAMPQMAHPAPIFLLSFVGRSVLSLLGFYLVMGGEFGRALACLLGFILMRAITTRRWGPHAPDLLHSQPEAPSWEGGAK